MEVPEPEQNLQLGQEMFQRAYLYYKQRGLSEDKLDKILNWMTLAEQAMIQAEAEKQMKLQVEMERLQAEQQNQQVADNVNAQATKAQAQELTGQQPPPQEGGDLLQLPQ